MNTERNMCMAPTVYVYSYRNCDPDDSQTGLAAHGGSLLALGFEGKVELLHAFVGASEGCMLLVPAVAAALDDPFLPFPGTFPLLP